MEGDRRLQVVLLLVAIVIFTLSYTVGYIVGKDVGFKKAKEQFEAEKQRLLKTLAELSPISRPVNETEEDENNEIKVETEVSSSETVETEKKTQEVTIKKEEPLTILDINKERFYLQLGVFKNAINAVKLVKELEEKGYKAIVIPTTNEKYSKVIVGYFSSKEEALKVKEELKSEGYNSILKRRQP